MRTKFLPIPSLELQAQSQQLVAYIRQCIHEAGGQLDFAKFMALALYAPGLGYYSGGLPKFGAAGDFMTAPELSPLFGYCLAQQCAQILEQTQGAILEFGAGSGKLAADVLQTLETIACLPQAYWIIEPSAELQQRQRQTIVQQVPHLLPFVSWLTELPQNFVGVVLANEVLDAMPVHLFEIEGQYCYERCVTWQADQFIWQRRVLTEACELGQRVAVLQKQYGQAWAQYSSEVSLMVPAWLRSVSQMMTQGAVLLIDYGFPAQAYYHPDRKQGTLMCHYHHHAHPEPFFYPGLQDITAHVDFSLVAEAAYNAGFAIHGYTTQANFLINSGLVDALAYLAKTETDRFALNQQVKLLTLPHEMGELFKVIALSKHLDIALQGFRQGNQQHKL